MSADDIIEPDVNSIQDDANLEKLQINEDTVNQRGEKVGTQDFELLKVLGKHPFRLKNHFMQLFGYPLIVCLSLSLSIQSIQQVKGKINRNDFFSIC